MPKKISGMPYRSIPPVFGSGSEYPIYEHIKSGEKARPWTGPKPWSEKGKSYTPDKGDGSAREL